MGKADRKLGDELVRKNLPEFVTMVDKAIANKNLIVALTPTAFKDEPELMYAAVYYALARNVMVTFHNGAPHPADKPMRSK